MPNVVEHLQPVELTAPPVTVHAWGKVGQLVDGVLEFVDLATAVCADGANGLAFGDPAEYGLYAPPGEPLVPLVAYWPHDKGKRATWLPDGRLPMGLDNPDNLRGHELIVQGRDAPAPGAYWSFTALQDRAYKELDARRYFDSAAVPGVVLPGHQLAEHGIDLGDMVLVTHTDKHGVTRSIWCQIYDIGPGHKFEVSLEACRQLGINSCARNGGAEDGTRAKILPGSRALNAENGRVVPWQRADLRGFAARADAYLGRTP